MPIEDESVLDLSVIIVTWNSVEFIGSCLDSLFKALSPEKDGPSRTEVIVIDNHSSDGSQEFLTKIAGIELILNEENLGFGSACNQGFRKARGRCVLLLNPDTITDDWTIKRLFSILISQKELAACGPQLHRATGAIYASAASFPSLANLLKKRMGHESALPWHSPADTVHRVDWLSGAFLMLRAAAIDKADLFDQRFFLYGEDIDLCKRLHLAGWGVAFWNGGDNLHIGGGCSKNSPEIDAAHFVGTVKYYQKHQSLTSILYRLLLGGYSSTAWLLKKIGGWIDGEAETKRETNRHRLRIIAAARPHYKSIGLGGGSGR